MAELQISRVHVERAPVLEPERHPPVVGRRHLRGPAIDEAEPAIVAGSADAVADAELDALGPVDLGAARRPPISAGFQSTRPSSLPSSSTARLPWSTPMTRRSSFFSTPSRR